MFGPNANPCLALHCIDHIARKDGRRLVEWSGRAGDLWIVQIKCVLIIESFNPE